MIITISYLDIVGLCALAIALPLYGIVKLMERKK